MVSTRFTASTSSSSVSAMKPVWPPTMISGTEPHGRAMTGVPHARASIMARPNGSGQSMVNRSARASPRNAGLSASPISPTNSTSGSSSSGRISRS